MLLIIILYFYFSCMISFPGHQTHDIRKQRNPAFSFGTRHAKFSNDCSPGPGYLVPANITKHGVDGTPKYSLYGRYKDQIAFKNPGPGLFQICN